jgi:osmotically-inducible protein OsmY
MQKPNHLLEDDVRDTFEFDPALDNHRIAVKADHGRVILTGSVLTYFDRVRAADDAWTVGGVKAVDNEILVGPVGEAINDSEVAARCRDALDHERFVPKASVTVTVTNGDVKLRGEVRNPFQRHAAEDAVMFVEGVLGVENLIAITSEPIPSDVEDRIHQAFKRNAIIDEAKIKITNEGHTIYLTGTVSSAVAMRQAVETASHAPGVREVINDLVIEP